MKPKLKEIYLLEKYEPLEYFHPDDESCFGISVRLMIGPDDDPGAESFDLLVCSPEWLKIHYAEEKIVWGHHMLIVFRYDFSLIQEKIKDYISKCTGNNWTEITHKLCRIGSWEFEDYIPYKPGSETS